MNNLLKISIKARLTFVTLLAMFGLLVTGAVDIASLTHFNDSVTRDFHAFKNDSNVAVDIALANVDFKSQVQEWKDLLIRGNDPEAFNKYKSQFLDKADRVQKRLTKAKEELQAAGSPHAAEVADLLAKHKEMLDRYLAALASFDPSNPETGKQVDKLVKGMDRPPTQVANQLTKTIVDEMETNFATMVQVNQAGYVSTRNTLLAIVAIAIVLVTALTYTVARQVSRSITTIQDSIDQVTSQLDLTRRVPVIGSDELARTGASLNNLFEHLQEILRDMRGHAEEVAHTSGQISESVTQLHDAVGRQNEATSSMAAAAQELAVSISQVSDGASMTRTTSQGSLSFVDKAKTITDQNMEAMARATNDVNATADVVKTLGQSVQDIGQIANVIKDIADQTNLLALNAAIEAARAGEQGRGFAVVADEVRRLAERTTTATSEIAQVISGIQMESARAVEKVGSVVALFGNITTSTSETGEAMTQIHKGSEDVVAMTLEISNALSEQKSVSENIAGKVEVISSMSETNTSAMSNVHTALKSMDMLSHRMYQDLARFMV